MKIVWSPLAIEKVSEIAGRIAEDDMQAALDWVNTIFEAVKRLEQFPESGRVVPEVKRKSIREVLQGAYRIIYRVKKEELAILTVRHGKQRLRRADLGEEKAT